MKSVDSKSLVIGGLAVLLVVCALGGVPLADGQFNNRFTLVASDSPTFATAFVLDTVTGQVWQYGEPEFHGPKLDLYDEAESIESGDSAE